MTVNPLARTVQRPQLQPGQPVHVNARSVWMPAIVAFGDPGRIGVTLSRAAGPFTRAVPRGLSSRRRGSPLPRSTSCASATAPRSRRSPLTVPPSLSPPCRAADPRGRVSRAAETRTAGAVLADRSAGPTRH